MSTTQQTLLQDSATYPDLFLPAPQQAAVVSLPTAPAKDLFDSGVLSLDDASKFCRGILQLLPASPTNGRSRETQSNSSSSWFQSVSTASILTGPSRSCDETLLSSGWYTPRPSPPTVVNVHVPPQPAASPVVVNNYNAPGSAFHSQEPAVEKDQQLETKKPYKITGNSESKNKEEKKNNVKGEERKELTMWHHGAAALVFATVLPAMAYAVRGDVHRWQTFNEVDRLYVVIKGKLKASTTDQQFVDHSHREAVIKEALILWKAIRSEVKKDIAGNAGTKAGMGFGGLATGVSLFLSSVTGLWGGALLFATSASYRLLNVYGSAAQSRKHTEQQLRSTCKSFLTETNKLPWVKYSDTGERMFLTGI